MLYRSPNKKIIILGINELSINLASNLSVQYNIIMLDKKKYDQFNNIDVIIDYIDNNLVNSLNKYSNSDTDIFIAMTENEEYNLFAAAIAREYGALYTIAMVYNSVYTNSTVVDYVFNPDQLVINKINSLVKETRLNHIKELIPGKISISNFSVATNDYFVGKKVRDFQIKDSQIIAIKRSNETYIAVDDFVINVGDILLIIYKKGMISGIINQLLKKRKVGRRVFIIGGNELAYKLAKSWSTIYYSIILLESLAEKCIDLAARTDNILILHGEGTERDLLVDEGMNSESIFLSLDQDDFHNILSSYNAKQFGCKTVITLLNHEKYKEIAALLNLNNLVYSADIVRSHLLMQIKTTETPDTAKKYILENNVYIMTVDIKSSIPLNKKIKDINNNNIKVGLIIRNDKIYIPDCESILEEGDTIFIFYNKKMERNINHIFT